MWLLLLVIGCEKHGTPGETDTDGQAGTTVLSVSSYFGDTIGVFDPTTGEAVGSVTGLDGPQGIAVAADGSWTACAELDNAIVRIDPVTLTVTGEVVASGAGGLQNPDGVAYGSDGRIYVSSFETDSVLRYEADGTFVDVAVAARAGGLNGPDIGIGFDPAGNLVVPGYYSNRIHRYDDSGEPLEDVLAAGNVDSPREVRWDSAGNVYVSGFDSDDVVRIGTDGTVTTLVELDGAGGFAIDEEAGVLYVASGVDDAVHAYELATGADLGVRVTADGIDGATAVELLPRP